jgi:Tol biopolymer transport system component
MKKETIGSLVVFILIFSISIFSGQPSALEEKSRTQEELSESPGAYCNPCWSRDGNHLLLTGPDRNGVYLYNISEGSLAPVTSGRSSGYWYMWAPDGKRFGYKSFEKDKSGRLLQVPAVYDIASGTEIRLVGPVARAGVPSFSLDGKTAFTMDTTLMILDSSYRVESTYELGLDVNLAPISPDGTKVVYNDNRDQLWLLNLDTSEKIRLTDGEEGWFGPVWSPDGSKIACSSIGGRLAVVDINSLTLTKIGRGSRHSWSPDGSSVLYSRYYGEMGREITGSDIFITSADGRTTANLTNSPGEFLEDPSLSSAGELAFCSAKSGKLFKAKLPLGEREVITVGDPCLIINADKFETVIARSEDQPADTAISGVPYLHQVYDTPNWFNGNWACNATSAMMCIAYYKILPYWDCTVSVPYSHVSHYGNYECEIYSFNGHTYNIASPDAGGTSANGGYGYIVQNNWEETRGHMAEYFAYHGMDNVAVDWSPTWAEFQAEVASLYPTVFLSLITTSGHYTVGIGYVTGWHTAIFNDPWGDKNTTPYEDYYGEHVYYDWPGYNNGYQNLTTMSCFIYARHAPSQPAINSIADINSCLQNGLQVNFTKGSAADRHDLYKDGALAVQNYISGAAYNPGDSGSHNYMIKAVNSVAGRSTDSSSSSGTDAVCSPLNEAAPGGTYENGQMWSGTTQSWPALTGADGYKLYRGVQNNLQYLLTAASDSCLRYQGAANSVDLSGDDASSEAGRFYWYLLVGTNGLGDGNAGNASAGARVVNSTGSCP